MSGSYLSRFPGFVPDDSASATDEFARLALFQKWTPKSKTYRKQWAEFFISEFRKHFNADAPNLENWQSLCRGLGIEGDLASLTKCKKV
jgi:hypothetical protein